MLRLFRHYVSGMLVVMVAADLAVMLAAIVLDVHLEEWVGSGAVWPKATAFVSLMLFALYLADLYDPSLDFGRRELAARLLIAVSAGATGAAALGFAVPALRFGRLAFVEIVCGVAVGLFGWRSVWLGIGGTERLRQRVLVLGVSGAAEEMVTLQTTGLRRFTILGFLADEPSAPDELPAGSELLGKTRDLLSLVDELRPDLVLVALRDMRRAFPVNDLLKCRLRGIRIEDWPTFYEKQTGKILVTGMRPSWLIFADGFVKTRLTRAVKRTIDLVLAVVGLLLTLPLMGLIALAIRLDSRGPVLFRQERVGQGGRIFVLGKFRSMDADAEERSGPVWASAHDPRVTRIGRILRKTRLDELPQLIQILRGEMSFIGPRPERPEFVQLLQRKIPFYMERLSVKPGLSGWAQVRCPYGASVEDALEKLQYDLYYIKNLSPFLDLLILFSTIQVVLFGRGAR
jgi:sugar transferase (PEP-CTERM system associated)